MIHLSCRFVISFAGNERVGTVRESTTYTEAASRVEDRRDAIGTAQKDSTNSAFSCPTTATTAAAATAPAAATGKFDSCLKLSRRQNRFIDLNNHFACWICNFVFLKDHQLPVRSNLILPTYRFRHLSSSSNSSSSFITTMGDST